ncbi:MAG: MazG nucleotide pyrophosphohydrolase domain-containing protein [Candidatus Woesearchaeota archaeon]
MEKHFSTLLEYCKKSIELDEWVRDNGFNGYCKEISKEAHEVNEAADKEDYANLREELGDVLMDLLMASLLAEEEGHFSSDDVISSALSKIERRRPYILEDRKVSKTESVNLWLDAKEKEKKNKND